MVSTLFPRKSWIFIKSKLFMDEFSKKKLWHFWFYWKKVWNEPFRAEMFNREYSWMTHPLKGFTSTPIIQVRKGWIIKNGKNKKSFRDEKNEIDNFGIMTSFYSIRQLGCILSTFMHRRHLMVWNVFAPRLLFEIAEFLVFLIFCFLILSTNVSIICSLDKGVSFSSAPKIFSFF